MVQGRVEPSPAEQLRELHKARDRYAALAEKLHDSVDPQLDPDEKLAQEEDARRIMRSYEKSITNSVVRMSSMDKTHRFARSSLGMRTWLAIFVAISALEGGLLLSYFRPEMFRLLLPQENATEVERAPSAPSTPTPAKPIKAAPTKGAPKHVIASPPRRVAPPAIPLHSETPKPSIRPAPPPIAAAPKPALVQTPPAAQPVPAPVTPPPAPAPIAAPPPAAAAPLAQPASPPPVATLAPAAPPPQQPATRAAVLTRLEAIAATHTRPPYPLEAKRLGQSGTTRMRLAISPQGAAGACEIVISSGSAQLDAAACNHVQRVWRWKAATQDGRPVAAGTEVTIVWNLLTAR